MMLQINQVNKTENPYPKTWEPLLIFFSNPKFCARAKPLDDPHKRLNAASSSPSRAPLVKACQAKNPKSNHNLLQFSTPKQQFL